MRKSEDYVDTVAWFSPSEGLYNSDQPSKTSFPIVCTVQAGRSLQAANRFVRYHTAGTTASTTNRSGQAARRSRSRKTFRYRIPEQATVSIFTPQFSLSRQVFISQFGPTVELPSRHLKAIFDPNTLDLRELTNGI